jgi:hypothetical protein
MAQSHLTCGRSVIAWKQSSEWAFAPAQVFLYHMSCGPEDAVDLGHARI